MCMTPMMVVTSMRASMRAPVSHTQASDAESRRSWCIIRRRHRSYHAWVRSTTHRFGSTTKPLGRGFKPHTRRNSHNRRLHHYAIVWFGDYIPKYE